MYATRILTLRKTIKDPRTGQLHIRKSSGHCQPDGGELDTSILETTETENSPTTLLNTDTQLTTIMPAAETQTEGTAQTSLRDEEMHRKLDTLVDRFDKIEKISGEYEVSLEFTQDQVKGLKEENAVLREALQELSLECKRNTHAIQGLTTKQENLDTITRKRNLVFEGLPE